MRKILHIALAFLIPPYAVITGLNSATRNTTLFQKVCRPLLDTLFTICVPVAHNLGINPLIVSWIIGGIIMYAVIRFIDKLILKLLSVVNRSKSPVNNSVVVYKGKTSQRPTFRQGQRFQDKSR